jgi:putative heme-binding domain-containing protein
MDSRIQGDNYTGAEAINLESRPDPLMTRYLTFLVLGHLLGAPLNGQRTATPVERIRVAEGFSVERLYSVPRAKQGSWVAMCQDDKGRLITSDQYGSLYRFAPPPLGQELNPASIERIDLPVGHAQGLCYAFESLYVVVNSRHSETGSGVFRLLDTDRDDKFDKVVVVRRLDSVGGEHGPHAILPSPGGQGLTVLMGNQTRLPVDYTHSRVPELWGEDQLLPPMEHFMKGARAPVGHIARIDPKGETWEVIATGFRNQYDGAFNKEGELFTYDADMEGDLNTPWYRPTRINHVISGADFGWRTGSAKFADHVRDSFGAVVDIGPGSPTGVCFGYGAKFPRKYREALFVCDWSYGKMYAVHLSEKGSTYEGRFEEFASGAPFPLTDIVINPEDGAMYCIVGGRRVQSGLYRITYRGDWDAAGEVQESVLRPGQDLRKKRLVLEALLLKGARRLSRIELVELWRSVSSDDDRALRHAVRAVLEKHSVEMWKDLVLGEENCNRAGLGLIALARAGAPRSAGEVMDKVVGFDYGAIGSEQDRLNLLRALTLALTRGGQPEPEIRLRALGWLENIYPVASVKENRDLTTLLAALESPLLVPRAMKLLETSTSQEEQITYAMNLRFMKEGWSPTLRLKYFQWLARSGNYNGGPRFRAFLSDIRRDAIASVPAGERTSRLKKLFQGSEGKGPVQFSSKPRQVVKDWSMEDLQGLLGAGLEGGRSFSNGRKMFGIGSCHACHRFDGEGGAVGPDLTSVHGKFSPYDLLESIVNPGAEVSDQYDASVFTLRDGGQVVGRIMNLNRKRDGTGGDVYRITTDMMRPNDTRAIRAEEVLSIEPSGISMMPRGLLSTMEDSDILDLLAYLLSSGDRDDPMFKN